MAIPMIDSRRVGVKSPVAGKDSGAIVGVTLGVVEGLALGIAEGVAVTVGLGVGVGVGLEEVFGVGLAVGVGIGVLPDGVATKAGTSPACTTKFLVNVLVIPVASNQEMVIEWGPSESGVDGL